MDAELIKSIRAERGYTLSYHEIYARTEPEFLRQYANLYRAFTLNERYLTDRERELVWVGILVADREAVGTLHLERALLAGITASEIADAVSLASLAEGLPALEFAKESWTHVVPFDLWKHYEEMIRRTAPQMTTRELHLCGLATQGALTHRDAFVWHLCALYDENVPEREIAEAISYLLLPKGANTMLWATDVWLDTIREGKIRAGAELADVELDTRRS